MKTSFITLLLCSLFFLGTRAQQPAKGKSIFTGKWQMTALLHKTISPDDLSKTYEFSHDSVIVMKSSRYQITGKYTFDEKTSTLAINIQENEVLFRIIFLSPDKMQWHSASAADDHDDGIIERVPE